MPNEPHPLLTKEERDRFDATMRRLENRRYAFAGHHPEGDLFHEGALAIWELLRYVSQLETEIAQLRAQLAEEVIEIDGDGKVSRPLPRGFREGEALVTGTPPAPKEK